MTGKAQRTGTQIAMFDEAQTTVGSAGMPAGNDDGGVAAAPMSVAEEGDRANGIDNTPADDAVEVSWEPLAERSPPKELTVDGVDAAPTDATDANAGELVDGDAQQASDEQHVVAARALGATGTPPDGTATLPSATLGDVRFVPLGALLIASDNVWGGDIVRDEHFRRLQALAASSTAIEPLLVVPAGAGWAIVGDPGPYLALVEAPGATAGTWCRSGRSRDRRRRSPAISAGRRCSAGRSATCGGPGSRSRSARSASRAAPSLRTWGSPAAPRRATSRRRVSSVSTRLSRHCWPARPRHRSATISTSAIMPIASPTPPRRWRRLPPPPSGWRVGTLTPVAGKAALGVTRKAPTLRAPHAAGRRYLDPTAGAEMVAVERTDEGKLRLVMTFAGGSEPLDAQAVRYAEWLRTLAPPSVREE